MTRKEQIEKLREMAIVYCRKKVLLIITGALQ